MSTYRYILIILIIITPLVSAFVGKEQLNQKWWQRKKQTPPTEELITLNQESGQKLTISFKAGKRHNHPLMAFWIEDTSGVYIHSLYVAQSIAKGNFRHGDPSTGRWEPGPLRRPAALPYWGHKRGIKADDGYYIPDEKNPMPDAVSGATPTADFILKTRTRQNAPDVFHLMMEINQSWDWNHYWHNNKFPDDPHYKTSSQPAIVYKVLIDIRNPQPIYKMEPIGHSHWSGANGNLYDDLSTITTALNIAEEIIVKIEKE